MKGRTSRQSSVSSGETRRIGILASGLGCLTKQVCVWTDFNTSSIFSSSSNLDTTKAGRISRIYSKSNVRQSRVSVLAGIYKAVPSVSRVRRCNWLRRVREQQSSEGYGALYPGDKTAAISLFRAQGCVLLTVCRTLSTTGPEEIPATRDGIVMEHH